MKKKLWSRRTRKALAAAAACVFVFCACSAPVSPSSGSSSQPPSSSAEAWDPVPAEVAALGDKTTDVDILVSLDDQVTRDDLGITVEIAPVDFQRYIQALTALELRPLEDGDPALDIPKPFTLAFSWQGKEYSYAFSSQKITVNGADAYPANPAALEELYEGEKEGYEGLLTQDIYCLREDMDFAPEDVASVELASLSGFDENRLVMTSPDEIRRAYDSLGSLVVWKLGPNDPANPKTGGASSCTFTLGDGSTRQYETARARWVDGQGKETFYGEVSLGYGSLFDPLSDASQTGVSLYATMSGASLPVFQTQLDYQGARKSWASSMGDVFPGGLYYGTDPVISPGSDTACVLAFRDAQGSAVAPAALSAALWQEDPDSGEQAPAPAPDFSGSTLLLPGEIGKYTVQVTAEFPGGSGTYFFEYRVTDLPSFFWDIEYGNNQGDVTFARSDAGLSIPGSQNRQYVSFILSLGLRLAGKEEAASIPPGLKEPFSMTFQHQDESCTFAFSPQGVTMDGQPCVLSHPERVADLYIPLTAENAMQSGGDGLVDYGLRGFLSKELGVLADIIPASGLKSILVLDEGPRDFTRYDATDSLKGDLTWMDEIILAKGTPQEDYYWPRRFFLSYQITTGDGTVYQLGEELLKDGEATGWYSVYTDLPQIEALVGSLEGETIQREEPLPTALSVDENGRITFS